MYTVRHHLASAFATLKGQIMVKLRTRLFQMWFRVARPMTLGVRGLVINDQGEVLLIRHTYTPGWYLPGGGVERGEPAIEALRRELVEEAGVALTQAPDLIGIFSNHPNFRNDHVLLYRISPTIWEACEATSVGEIAEVGWFNPEALPEGTTAGTRRRVREWANDLPLPPLW
jgi:8-oxo-dGTP pyrophosphatase MutT (NUDIX family)